MNDHESPQPEIVTDTETSTDIDAEVDTGRRPRRHRWIAVIVIIALLPVAWLVFQRAVDPDDPSSFYSPPATLPDGPPGTIIRQESVTTSTPDVDVTRILYTSTGADGSPIPVSGIVVSPVAAPPAGGWPVVAWAHGTTGIQSRCAPSLEDNAGLAKIPEVAQLVASGKVVVATDYVGLGTPGPHPYLVGESEGRAVLDIIRAAHTLLDGQTSATSVVYGHSQGGHAVLFTAELAPTYAPELKVVGAAAMAPPTDLGKLLELDKTEPPGLVLTALALSSWSQLYPQAKEDEVVHAVARPFVADIGGHCVLTTDEGEISALPAVIALRASFLSTDPATAPGWSELLSSNSPGPAPQTVPLLVSQGLADVMVRPEVTKAYVEQQCAAGASIQFDTYTGVGHFQLKTVAAADVIAWLDARLAGEPATPGCTSNLK